MPAQSVTNPLPVMLDIQDIAKILPQAEPFIMIDRVIDYKKNEYLTAVKNITGSEWVFEGQGFQSNVYPETLIIEGAAQAGIAFYNLTNPNQNNKNPIYIGLIKSEFFNQAYIGDQLQFQTVNFKMMSFSGYINVKARHSADVADITIFYSTRKEGV